MSLSGTIWINRGNTASALKAMAATAEDIKLQKKSLFIFPEGTRTLSPELTLKPFKKGAFHLAVQSGLPIVPVVCQNYEGLFGKGHFESGECEVRSEYLPASLAMRGHHILTKCVQQFLIPSRPRT